MGGSLSSIPMAHGHCRCRAATATDQQNRTGNYPRKVRFHKSVWHNLCNTTEDGTIPFK